MEKDKGTLEIRDDTEALWYAGKKRTLIIYLHCITLHISFFFSTWYVISESEARLLIDNIILNYH